MMRLAHRSNHSEFDARRSSHTLFPETTKRPGLTGLDSFGDEDEFYVSVEQESEIPPRKAHSERASDRPSEDLKPAATTPTRALGSSPPRTDSFRSPGVRRSLFGWLGKSSSDSSSLHSLQYPSGHIATPVDSDDDERSTLPEPPKLYQSFSEMGAMRTDVDPDLQTISFDDDLQYVPAAFEVEDVRRDGRRRVLYAFKIPNHPEELTVLRSYTEFG